MTLANKVVRNKSRNEQRSPDDSSLSPILNIRSPMKRSFTSFCDLRLYFFEQGNGSDNSCVFDMTQFFAPKLHTS